ncbi:hypothetical protein [Texcoconibacillus texcoconensis]|uniref:UVR domain-containing protein n=1 Tax=Texcoconibacillus texcoconensis TaxID=1095777 RepID=A0A840QLZ5_9BACI|nr:hypothetical protein [Texcoconibacillus texcoconensis]MBB5172399.1 hypothetical protein [Texcoconibacillus texcoconensis]
MYKVEPNLKEMLNLPVRTTEDLRARYDNLRDELQFARSAFEFEKASEVKLEMVYIIEELKNRKHLAQGDDETSASNMKTGTAESS